MISQERYGTFLLWRQVLPVVLSYNSTSLSPLLQLHQFSNYQEANHDTFPLYDIYRKRDGWRIHLVEACVTSSSTIQLCNFFSIAPIGSFLNLSGSFVWYTGKEMAFLLWMQLSPIVIARTQASPKMMEASGIPNNHSSIRHPWHWLYKHMTIFTHSQVLEHNNLCTNFSVQ